MYINMDSQDCIPSEKVLYRYCVLHVINFQINFCLVEGIHLMESEFEFQVKI